MAKCLSAILLILVILGAAVAPVGAAPPGQEQAEERPYRDAWQDRITAEFQDTPFRKALARLYRGSHLQYAVDPKVPDLRVTLSIQGLPRRAALRSLSRWMRARLPAFIIDSTNEFWVYKLFDPSTRDVADPPRFGPSEVSGWERQISVDFRETPFRKALAMLYVDSYLGYAVDPEIPDVSITLSLRDISMREALRSVQRVITEKVPTFFVDSDQDFRVYRLEARRVSP
jgi:hypothetical protein